MADVVIDIVVHEDISEQSTSDICEFFLALLHSLPLSEISVDEQILFTIFCCATKKSTPRRSLSCFKQIVHAIELGGVLSSMGTKRLRLDEVVNG